MAYSLMMIAKHIGSCFLPIWGALADRLVAQDGRQCRRWMIVVGISTGDTAILSILWQIPTWHMAARKGFSKIMTQ